MSKQRRWIYAVVAGLCLIATACSSSAQSGGSSSPTSATSGTTSSQAAAEIAKILAPVLNEPTSLEVTTPLSKRPPQGLKIVGLDDGLAIENLYYVGLKQAAKVLGWNFSTQTIDDTNIQSVISGATSAINEGANAVIMISELQSTIKQFLPLAQQHHTLIFDAISSNQPGPGHIVASTSDHEDYQQGRYAMAAILQQAGTSSPTTIAETYIPQTASEVMALYKGLSDVKNSLCPKCTIENINISEEDLGNGAFVQDILSYFQTHPSVHYLFVGAGFFLTGLVQAFHQAGIQPPKIVGIEPTAPQFSALKSGAAQEWLYVPQQVLGWVWADQLARYFTNGNYNVWNTTAYAPQWLLTPQNIKQVSDINDITFPADYQSEFEKLWQVS